MDGTLSNIARPLLTDPQTSGGLLVSCSAAAAPAVIDTFRRHGGEHAAIIGTMVNGTAGIRVGA